ncbi:hypothetical protein VSX61_21915, partial [Brenneria populi subsp. brevivirga]|uniref:hypothetical protein n=1 Tax=Brenneria populi TaxID=1505588 RepID=UPI002E17D385|nr:hypothetical protein [Brenneria populi subsp. brevivirga]
AALNINAAAAFMVKILEKNKRLLNPSPDMLKCFCFFFILTLVNIYKYCLVSVLSVQRRGKSDNNIQAFSE